MSKFRRNLLPSSRREFFWTILGQANLNRHHPKETDHLYRHSGSRVPVYGGEMVKTRKSRSGRDGVAEMAKDSLTESVPSSPNPAIVNKGKGKKRARVEPVEIDSSSSSSSDDIVWPSLASYGPS